MHDFKKMSNEEMAKALDDVLKNITGARDERKSREEDEKKNDRIPVRYIREQVMFCKIASVLTGKPMVGELFGRLIDTLIEQWENEEDKKAWY